MSDIALITIVGNLTQNATATPLEQNPQRVRVDFAVASSYYQKGQQERPKAYYQTRIWMSQERWAKVSTMLIKGAKVLVHGELRPRLSTYEGKERLWNNVEEAQFTMMGPKPEGVAGGHPQGGGGPPQGGGYDAPQGAPPQQDRYRTDPNHPGWYYDTQTSQWAQGAVPAQAPSGPPPGPPQGPPQDGPPPSTPPPAGGAPPGQPGGGPPAY